VRDRDNAIQKLEKIMGRLSEDPDSGFQLMPDTRWMVLLREPIYQVSSRHGHPLHGKGKKEIQLPWNGVAYLRLRSYLVMTPAGAYVPSAMPGTADLTLKMKKLDPKKRQEVMQTLGLKDEAEGAKLVAKLENDVHCNHERTTFSPLYTPVPQNLDISTIAAAKPYFPQLADLVKLEDDYPLPLIHEVWRAKIVWTVVFRGVVGEANLVIKYNTTFEDAVAGRSPKNGEFSMRIRRKVAATTPDALHEGLMALARSCQVFRDHGWDGKTPGVNASVVTSHLSPQSSSSSSLSAIMVAAAAGDDDEAENFDIEGDEDLGTDDLDIDVGQGKRHGIANARVDIS